MAVRRPPAPRLRAGHPGAPALDSRTLERSAPTTPVPGAPPLATPPGVPQPEERSADAAAAVPAPGPAPAPARGPRRRALLLTGSAAALITVPVATAGLLARRGEDAQPSASSSGGGSSATTDLSSPFTDVADDAPGLAAMLWAADSGVQPAREDGSYAPRAAITRGEIALALHRFAGSPDQPTTEVPALITDLGPDPATTHALLWLHGRGALWGDHELRVRPEAEATRAGAAQMVVALLRPALAGLGVTWDPTSAATVTTAATLAGLPDLGGDDPSAEAVHWLAATGMLVTSQVAEDSAWDGEQVLTREHLALALHRIDGVIVSALP